MLYTSCNWRDSVRLTPGVIKHAGYLLAQYCTGTLAIACMTYV